MLYFKPTSKIESKENTDPNTVHQIQKVKHKSLPLVPLKVISAPGLEDDFYLNNLDWSKRNLLAVALFDQ